MMVTKVLLVNGGNLYALYIICRKGYKSFEYQEIEAGVVVDKALKGKFSKDDDY